jgi:hypothetical protein
MIRANHRRRSWFYCCSMKRKTDFRQAGSNAVGPV